MEKDMENFIQNSRSPGPVLKAEPPEYEATELVTPSQYPSGVDTSISTTRGLLGMSFHTDIEDVYRL
jgi:hypothetical protein